ncbi:uncharacterized protein LOC143017607 [Oratosquilla oratoria]|uniref:uncharacterized protein LOC143017607 n=1 Tax=Oratosquilla oratoria TaxID=337810 RepID=UPI003F762DE2
MKTSVLLTLLLVGAALARPNIIDIELDDFDHEQDGVAGHSVEGEYSWIAPDGEEYRVKYVADHRGYRIVDSNIVHEFRDLDANDNPEPPSPQGRAEAPAEVEDADEEVNKAEDTDARFYHSSMNSHEDDDDDDRVLVYRDGKFSFEREVDDDDDFSSEMDDHDDDDLVYYGGYYFGFDDK